MRFCLLMWLLACAPPLIVAEEAHGALISELFYDAIGPDNGLGFVEITGSGGEDLEGWSLWVINGSNGSVATTISLGGAIPPDRVFVVADRGEDDSTSVPNADRIENFDIQNGPDSLQLVDALGSVVDAVGFGDFGPTEIFAGEGSAALDVPAGSSLERPFGDLDTGDNAIDFAAQGMPTPGFARFRGDGPPPPPSAPIPEPSSALLWGLGLAWLGRCRLSSPTLRRRSPRGS